MVRGNRTETNVLAPPPQCIIIIIIVIIIIIIIVIIHNYIGITTHDNEVVTYMLNHVIIQCDTFITN